MRNIYKKESPLSGIYYKHVEEVADRALIIADRVGFSSHRKRFLLEATMLHDIGIINVNWPPLHCYGEKSYLSHWVEGYEILLREGLSEHAEVAKRHATPPLDQKVVEKHQLPDPASDYEPITIEQRIIAYCDLYSSKCPDKIKYVVPKDIDGVIEMVAKYSPQSPKVIYSWAEEFGEL